MSRIRVTIAADGLSADASAETGTTCTRSDVLGALTAAGVIAGIDEAAIDALVGRLAAGGAGTATVVARGEKATAGEDGRVERVFAMGQLVGRRHPDGRIDYHERELLHPVADKQLVATIVPPTAGTAGTDVRGRRIEPAAGKPHAVRFGPGVRIEGETIVAARAGVMLQDARLLDVVPLYQHGGDVDLRSGNLHTEGSLAVRGELRDGFAVSAAGDVQIGGAVQHGTVTAGGSVRVGAGLLDGSVVKARGSVVARHVTSSRIEAGAEIVLADEATHAQLRADDIRIVTGRGTAFGGELRARGTIAVVNAGTATGAVTVLSAADITDESAAFVKATNQDSKVDRTAARVRRDAGGPPGKAARASLKGADAVQQQKIALAQRQRALLQNAAIHVQGTLHPGVRIQFGTRILVVDSSRTKRRFRWDAEQDRILEELIP